MNSEEMIKRAREVFDVEIEGLVSVRDSLGESFTRTVSLVLETLANGGLIVVSGVGKNLHIAEKMSAIFASTGTRSIVLNPDAPMAAPRSIDLIVSPNCCTKFIVIDYLVII